MDWRPELERVAGHQQLKHTESRSGRVRGDQNLQKNLCLLKASLWSEQRSEPEPAPF